MITAAPSHSPAPPCPAAKAHAGWLAGLGACRWEACAIRLVVICMLAGAAAASAQEQPAPPPGPPALGEPIPEGSVLRLLGRDVTGPRGEVVAQVVNVLVDASGQPRAAILDYGGFLGVGKRRIAVAWRTLRFTPGKEAGTVTLLLHRDQLTNFPEYKPDARVIAAAPAEGAPSPPEAGAPPVAQE